MRARAGTSTASDRVPCGLQICRSSGVGGCLDVPGSKSYTNRALVIAGLANGTSRIANPLVSDDADSMVSGLRALGANIVQDSAGRGWSIVGTGGALSPGPIVVDANLAGTTLRFLTAVAVLGCGGIEVTGRAPLRQRPVGPLLEALRSCGACLSGRSRK